MHFPKLVKYDFFHIRFANQIRNRVELHPCEVRSRQQLYAADLSVLTHSDYDVVTLLTCAGWNKWLGTYRYRQVVQAVLVQVSLE